MQMLVSSSSGIKVGVYLDLNGLYLGGGNLQTLTSTTSGYAGLGILWNNLSGTGCSLFVNYSQGGTGG